MVPVWKSKDDLQKLVLSLHHVMSGIKLRLNSLAAGAISVGQPWWYYRAERPHVMRTEQGLWFSGSRSPLTLLLRCGEKCLAQPEHQEKDPPRVFLPTYPGLGSGSRLLPFLQQLCAQKAPQWAEARAGNTQDLSF